MGNEKYNMYISGINKKDAKKIINFLTNHVEDFNLEYKKEYQTLSPKVKW